MNSPTDSIRSHINDSKHARWSQEPLSNSFATDVADKRHNIFTGSNHHENHTSEDNISQQHFDKRRHHSSRQSVDPREDHHHHRRENRQDHHHHRGGTSHDHHHQRGSTDSQIAHRHISLKTKRPKDHDIAKCDICNCGPDLYSTMFGPTIDETFLVAYQTMTDFATLDSHAAIENRSKRLQEIGRHRKADSLEQHGWERHSSRHIAPRSHHT